MENERNIVEDENRARRNLKEINRKQLKQHDEMQKKLKEREEKLNREDMRLYNGPVGLTND